MHKYIKTLVKVILTILPVFCTLLFALSIGALVISLNPDVKWNEYNDEAYGLKSYYFNTIWSSLDGFTYAASHGKYLQMLSFKKIGDHDESWKISIRSELYNGIGLISGALLLLTIAMAVHNVTKQKLFTVILQVIAFGNGTTGGYFTIQAISHYKDGMIGAILKTSVEYGIYKNEKDHMKMGYNLAKYSAIISLIACGLILANICLYIPVGDGKWIWQRNAVVIPDTENSNLEKTQDSKVITETIKKKGDIITVQEVDQ